MKATASLILILALQLGWTQSSRFDVSPNPNNISFISDYSDHNAHGLVSNQTGSKIQVSWIREIKQKPDDWVCYVCDDNYCYGEHIDASPFLNNVNPNKPTILDVHMLDNNVIGHAHVVLWVFEKEDSSKKLRTDYFFNKIIENDNYQNSDINISDHPFRNIITVSYIRELKRIEIYSILGNKVIAFNPSTDGNYDISSLRDGMYCVLIIGPNDQLLGKKKIVKNSIR